MQERLVFHQGIIFCHRITCNKWFFQTCKKHPLTLMRLQGQALLGVGGVCGKLLPSLRQKGSRRGFTYCHQPEERRKQLPVAEAPPSGEKIFDCPEFKWPTPGRHVQGKWAQGRAKSARGRLKKIHKKTSFVWRSITCSAPAEQGPCVSSNRGKKRPPVFKS